MHLRFRPCPASSPQSNIVSYIHLGEAGKDDFQEYVEGKGDLQLQV